MAIPVILAETLAVTELYLLFTKKTSGRARQISRIAGIAVGLYFTGVFIYLFKNAVVPLTSGSDWRGIADVIAVGMYLLGIIPLAGIALLELGLLYKHADDHKKRMAHAFLIGTFLVVAHIAMIFGMLDPTKLGYTDVSTVESTQSSSPTHDMSKM